jgi:hypothetical protein
MSMINKWANFLANEKLDPEYISQEDTNKLMDLCIKLDSLGYQPKISMYKHKMESRKILVGVSMDMGIDLLSIKHKFNGKRLIGRGLLDVWNQVYQERFGSTVGTAGSKEAQRRDVKIKLSNLRRIS